MHRYSLQSTNAFNNSLKKINTIFQHHLSLSSFVNNNNNLSQGSQSCPESAAVAAGLHSSQEEVKTESQDQLIYQARLLRDGNKDLQPQRVSGRERDRWSKQ